MASHPLASTGPPAQQTLPLSADLLESIFLRLASPVDLARVSAACTAFRQLIADPDFLRRHRSVHPPLFLGFLSDGLRRVKASSHPNAAAARALATRADAFSFDYLPRGSGRWIHTDVCEGRVLLKRLCDGRKGGGDVLPELAVCDPLSRRYQLLPPIPVDLITSVQAQNHKSGFFGSFLVPSGHHEDTSFQVMGRTHSPEKVVIFIFSSESGQWSVGACTSWTSLGFNVPLTFYNFSWPQYDNGCFYWKLICKTKVLKLNINTMELSIVDLPLGTVGEVVIVEAGEGRFAMFNQIQWGNAVSYYTTTKTEGEWGNDWQWEKEITLPCQCNMVGAAGGYIFLIGFEDDMKAMCFSLQIKTSKIERICSPEYLYYEVHPYFGFPPFMSPPRRI